MDDISRKKDYEKSANQYFRWIDAGNNLLIAAKILEDNYKEGIEKTRKVTKGKLPLSVYTLSQWIYFKAKSLELYMKALYIKQGNSATDGNGNLSKQIITHDLSILIRLIKISLDNNQVLLANKLSDAIMYWGSYPIPLQYKKWRPNMEGITGIQPIYGWGEKENKTLEKIINIIKQELDK